MHRRIRFAFLLLLLPPLDACRPSSSSPTPSAARQTASAPPPVPATVSVASASAAPPPAVDRLEEARQIMLQAAGSDLTQPFHIEHPEPRPSPYREYARRLGAPELVEESSELVVSALNRMGPGGRQALVDWVMRPGTRPKHRHDAYSMLSMEPRPGDLPAFRTMLQEPGIADEVTVIMPYGPLGQLMGGLRVQCSGLAKVLVSIWRSKAPESSALLLQYANDRSLTEPNPKVLAEMRCSRSGRNEAEARALASLRLWALSLLEDPVIWQQVAENSTEPEWFRRWMRRLLKKEPLVSSNSPQQRRRVADLVASPCLY